MIADLKPEIALLKRDRYGRTAERSAKLLDQPDLQLGELVADAAGQSLRGVALGLTSSLFAGSERGGQRIARVSDTPVSRRHGLLPWNWTPTDKTANAVTAAYPTLPGAQDGPAKSPGRSPGLPFSGWSAIWPMENRRCAASPCLVLSCRRRLVAHHRERR